MKLRLSTLRRTVGARPFHLGLGATLSWIILRLWAVSRLEEDYQVSKAWVTDVEIHFLGIWWGWDSAILVFSLAVLLTAPWWGGLPDRRRRLRSAVCASLLVAMSATFIAVFPALVLGGWLNPILSAGTVERWFTQLLPPVVVLVAWLAGLLLWRFKNP